MVRAAQLGAVSRRPPPVSSFLRKPSGAAASAAAFEGANRDGRGLAAAQRPILGGPLRRKKPSPRLAWPPRSAAHRRRALRGDRTCIGRDGSEAAGGLLKPGPANNSLEPTRKRRAKMVAGLADEAATHYRGTHCR